MRSWLLSPIVFYPLLIAAACGLVLMSFGTRLLAAPTTASARIEGETVVIPGPGLAAATIDPSQTSFIVRNGGGAPTALRLAVLPGQGLPTPAYTGARVPLTREAADALAGRAVRVTVTVRPLPVTTAAQLAISLQGQGDANWQVVDLTGEEGVLAYTFPPLASGPPTAVGLRVISANDDYSYGIEIATIALTPIDAAAAPAVGEGA
jgi:hypothetical protein